MGKSSRFLMGLEGIIEDIELAVMLPGLVILLM